MKAWLKAAWKKLTWTMVAGWLASLSVMLTAVIPILPESTSPEVRLWLGIVAVAIAALTHSPRPSVPPVDKPTEPS